jgi:superfamily II RNA helicase
MSASRMQSPDPMRPPLGSAAPITEWKGFRLSLFQIQAIEALRAGENVLLAAPTGAGKTLVAEYAIADAVARGRRCVYTAPIKALSNQKYRDFRDAPDMEVGLMTGDVTVKPGAQVLIMTTEILRNAIFEDPGGLHDVDYVIFDEVHFMDDAERGSVWEESLIFAPPEIRFISLSATIANVDELGAWMREVRRQGLRIVQSRRRPVPLEHRLHTTALGLFDAKRLEWARRRAEAADQSRRRRELGRRGRTRAPRPRGLAAEELDGLFDHLQKNGLLPTLAFSFSRRDCEKLALRNRRRTLLTEEEEARMDALQAELVRLFQLREGALDDEIFRLARHGVGYHHAGMLPIHKEVVERMFTSGLIKLLFTTETFALGINMPARTVVFSSLRKFDGESFGYLRTREFLQMAGRAGRQGIDAQGLVIAHLEPDDLEQAPLERLLSGRPEPVLSRFRLSYASILHLYGALGRERVHEAWQKSFNQFQHRAKSRKARERNQVRQREVVDAHLELLAELGYLDRTGGLLPRGGVARLLYGFELQITEMLFRGVLEPLPPKALGLVFVGLVHEERRRAGSVRPPARPFGGLRRQVDELVETLARSEQRYGIPVPLKAPDWGLCEAVDLWFDGRSLEELSETTGIPGGDLCRTFRLALQLVRQVRRTLDRRDDLHHRLGLVIEAMNREEVDARRQLELG